MEKPSAAGLFVVSAPSGAGKSTLTQRLVERNVDLRLSISCTTRPIRGDERDGREYHFLSQKDFAGRIEKGEFIEWAQVHGHYYGTSRKNVDELLSEGYGVLFDIDVQGAASIRRIYPEARLIFIVPPSKAELERRLRKRKTDDPAEIKKRLNNALGEILQARQYDHIVLNDDLDEATRHLEAIIRDQAQPGSQRSEVLQQLEAEFSDGKAEDRK